MTAREQLDVELDVLAADDLAEGPTDQQLKTIAYLGRLLLYRRQIVADLNAALKTAEDQLRQTAEVDLPEAMLDAHLRSYTLAGGTGIAVEEMMYCGVSKERMPEVAAWLREHDHDAILKAQVITAFSKGQIEGAQALLRELTEKRYNVKLAETIHPQTLGAWVREMRAKVAEARAADEAPPEFPEELFGVYVRTVATVLEPKKPKRGK